MGTPDISKEALENIYNAGFEIVGVVTQPDRPSGRGMKVIYSPVKEYALEKGFKIFQPEKISKNDEFKDEIRALDVDLVVVVSYGVILPKSFINIPKLGCVNLHPSMLPKYRGPAPIQWAILNGDEKTGVTIMYINEKMDAGDIIVQEEVAIDPDETTGDLWARLSKIGARMLVESIKKIEDGTIKFSYDKADRMWLKGRNILEKMGFCQYEVSNFAKKGFEARHNSAYWKQKNYVGVGAGASGTIYDFEKKSAVRWTNTLSIPAYIRGVDEEASSFSKNLSCFKRNIEELDEETLEFEFLMLGFRKIALLVRGEGFIQEYCIKPLPEIAVPPDLHMTFVKIIAPKASVKIMVGLVKWAVTENPDGHQDGVSAVPAETVPCQGSFVPGIVLIPLPEIIGISDQKPLRPGFVKNMDVSPGYFGVGSGFDALKKIRGSGNS